MMLHFPGKFFRTHLQKQAQRIYRICKTLKIVKLNIIAHICNEKSFALTQQRKLLLDIIVLNLFLYLSIFNQQTSYRQFPTRSPGSWIDMTQI